MNDSDIWNSNGIVQGNHQHLCNFTRILTQEMDISALVVFLPLGANICAQNAKYGNICGLSQEMKHDKFFCLNFMPSVNEVKSDGIYIAYV